MAKPPIGLQLYSLRAEIQDDFAGVVTKLAEIGYAGIEPFGSPDNLAEAATLYKDLGIAVPSAHVPFPSEENRARVLEIAEAYGLERIVSGKGPDDFKTMDGIKRSCDEFNAVGQWAAEHGLTFGIHNHWWEYLQVDGQYVYKLMQEWIDPAVFFQVDVYWVQVAGPNPAAVITELGGRAPLLHIKDGPASNREDPMTAVGDGVVDIPAIVKAGEGATEWLIVELDRCATDMMEAVEKSFRYLEQEGLGRGK
ncbi:MAG: sugar phosphate isomerase/epimerase [Anaerolineae bacterium]|nr:sugar phosphate isomerase/epimerase [Anaerolineae bacterium]